LLAGAALAGGFFAPQFGAFADRFAVSGIHAAELKELHLWHGFTKELGLSALVVALGVALYFAVGRVRWAELRIPDALRLDRGFEKAVEAVPYWGKALNRTLGFETPYVALYVVSAAGLALFLGLLWPHLETLGALAREWRPLPAEPSGWWRWAVVFFTGGGALAAASWKQPVRQVCALCVVGLGITLYFVLYQAPDLALTQMLVDTATLLLILLVVFRLKRDGADLAPLAPLKPAAKILRGGLAGFMGLVVGGGVLIFQRDSAAERAGEFYIGQTVPLAKGANAVNTVLVDFRGFDTLLEIAVLLIAALGCLGLLHRSRAGGWASSATDTLRSRDLHPVPRDLILQKVAVWGFIPLNLFAAHLFLRGHQAPGGGFIAGLVTALSLILLVFALGVGDVRRLVGLNPVGVASFGVLLSALTALAPIVFGYPLFYHVHGYVFGFYIGSPFWFDLGVYLTVVGVLLKIMLPLLKSIHGLPAFVVEEEGRFAERDSEPIDLAPLRTDAKETR
jgi:multisubunit Na+/H+ antiporter MnhB subunit